MGDVVYEEETKSIKIAKWAEDYSSYSRIILSTLSNIALLKNIEKLNDVVKKNYLSACYRRKHIYKKDFETAVLSKKVSTRSYTVILV